MKSLTVHIKRVCLAVVALSSVIVMQSSFAVGTPSNTDISNTAAVNYQVGGVSQNVVSSTAAIFKVDRKVIFTVAELSGGNTIVNPGQNNGVTAFTVTNTGNGSEGFQLTAANLVGGVVFGNTDNQNMNNLRVFVDSNNNNTYDPASDTATVINSLARDASVTVFVVADTPLAATNGQFANVQLTARAAVAGTSGATLETETATDTVGAEDVVIADTGRDNSEAASDQYAIQSASLSVTKTSSVFSDPINGTTNPKAIPGATVQYTIVIQNNGLVAATGVYLNDDIPGNTLYAAGTMTYQVNAGAASALTDAADADSGAYISTGTPKIVIGNTTGNLSSPVISIPAGQSVTVRFRVTVN